MTAELKGQAEQVITVTCSCGLELDLIIAPGAREAATTCRCGLRIRAVKKNGEWQLDSYKANRKDGRRVNS